MKNHKKINLTSIFQWLFVLCLSLSTHAQISNGSFELPALAANGWDNTTPIPGWTRSNNTLIVLNGTGNPYGSPTPPNGSQVVAFQGATSLTQTFTLGTAGTYFLQFSAAQRQCCVAPYNQSMEVRINGVLKNTITPTLATFQVFSTDLGYLAAGTHTVSLTTVQAVDKTIYLDNVNLLLNDVDSDNDLIVDKDDLDDDNDGLVDTVDGCTDPLTMPLSYINYSFVNSSNANFTQSGSPFGQISGTLSVSQGIILGAGGEIVYNENGGIRSWVMTVTSEGAFYPRAVRYNSMVWDGAGRLRMGFYRFTLSDGTVLVNPGATTSQTFDGGTMVGDPIVASLIDGNTYYGDVDSDNNQGAGFTIFTPAVLDQIAAGRGVVRIDFITNSTRGTNQTQGAFSFIGTYKACRDFDGDGAKDYLDTDSDNDGCADAIEGSANFTANDIDANSRLTGGAQGNGIPTVAGTGQAAGSSFQATQLVVNAPVADQVIAEGASATFSVSTTASNHTSFSGGNPVYGSPGNANPDTRYQWYLDDPNSGGTLLPNTGVYTGTTSATLNISNTTGLIGSVYYVVITQVNNPCILQVRNATLKDACDPVNGFPDTDADGITDVCDLDDDNDGILDANEISCPKGTINDPLTNMAQAYNVPSGRYYFNFGAGLFQADVDATNGGGWVLVAQYVHAGGTNPNLTAIGANGDLPINSTAALGTNESAIANRWGHAGNARLNSFTNATEFRFYGVTSGHSRVMHFRTTSGMNYAKTGTGSFAGINTNFTALAGHNANLPGTTTDVFSNQGNNALTEFPFYQNATAHWGIKGLTNRWEVDDVPNNFSLSTIHKVWARSAVPAPGTTCESSTAGNQQLVYEFYNASYPSTNNIPTTGALATGLVNQINIATLQNAVTPGDPDNYSIRYSGFIYIATPGTYTFFTASDDASKLFINGTEVVNNDFYQGITERSGTITLAAGWHAIQIPFMQGGGASGLTVSYQGPSIAKQALPFSILSSIKPNDNDNDGIANSLDADSDNDGVPDALEANHNLGSASLDAKGRITTGINPQGVPTAADGGNGVVPVDTDNDGKPDYIDIDSDNDGIVDAIESQPTTGYVAPTGLDGDNDGIDNAFDSDLGKTLTIVLRNTDNVDTPDMFDLNSDNDSESDMVEAAQGTYVAADADGDGLANIFDKIVATGSALTNESNGGQTAGSPFPDVDFPGGEPDWRDPICTQLPNTAAATSFAVVGISTHATKQANWPTTVPNGALVIESSNKGFVISRITTEARDHASFVPVEGMLIYNTTVNRFQLRKAGAWVNLKRGCNN